MKAEVDNEICVGCGACVDACPVGAIKLEGGIAIVSDGCISCGACVSSCPTNAITL